MRKFVAVASYIAAYVLAGIANAADLPIKTQVYKATPATVYNWAGYYVGGDIGYGWDASSDPSLAFIDSSNVGLSAYMASGGIVPVATDPKGFIGGGLFGYNWQINNLVFGLVSDFNVSGIRTSATLVTATNGIGGTTTLSRKLDLFGTARGRVGWAEKNWLWYATGGLAYGQIQESLTFGSIAAAQAAGSHSQTRTGWTVGAGFEYGWSKWSAGLEYLYIDLGRSSVAESFFGYAGAGGDSVTMSSRNVSNIVRAVLNYRFSSINR